jgi:hypothetical protein
MAKVERLFRSVVRNANAPRAGRPASRRPVADIAFGKLSDPARICESDGLLESDLMSDTPHLGQRVRSHWVDTGRRWWHGLGFTTVGAVMTAVGILLAVVYLAESDFPIGPILGAILGLGLLLLVVGLVRLGQSLLRPDERFDVYEHGFVHVTRRRTRSVPWDQVTGLREIGDIFAGGLRSSLGVDYRCVVKVRDGSSVTFNTLTENADVLAGTIDEHRSAGRAGGSR